MKNIRLFFSNLVNMEYTSLTETAASPRGSIISIHLKDNINQNDHLCRGCKNKLIRKLEIDHTPIECLGHICELLESEVNRLKDHDMKSRLLIKELENRIIALDDLVKGITAPKTETATPYSFGRGHKVHQQLKKSISDAIAGQQTEISYNVIHPSSSNSREHVGLFGTRGASSQHN